MQHANGTGSHDQKEFQDIQEALRISYDPRAPKEARHSTLQYLNELKRRPDAPQYGLTFASDPSQPPHARHFGLSLLEVSIKYRWDEHSKEQAATLRDWVISLAQQMTPQDPAYLRNKIASLWVEVAKRAWPNTWTDMDHSLAGLWDCQDQERAMTYRVFVLVVLETLSDDICVREDSVSMLRQEALGQALNEILIPQGLFQDYLETRSPEREVRTTPEGWLWRMCDFLVHLAQMQDRANDGITTCAVRTLEALKPTATWISLQALVETKCVDGVLDVIASGGCSVQTTAVEVLYQVVSRPYNPHFQEVWTRIMRSVLRQDRIRMLHEVFSNANITAEDIDDIKHTLQKKISEVLSVLADAASQHPELLENEDQVSALYDLCMTVFSNESLLVSIPVLHSLSKTLKTRQPSLVKVLDLALGDLLRISSDRLLPYESLPKDADHPVVVLLDEDFETLPEQHAFLGNYRRYCVSIIENIAQTKPAEALQHILGQTMDVIQAGLRADLSSYTKNAIPILQLVAQHGVVKSALSGFTHWVNQKSVRVSGVSTDPAVEQTRQAITHDLERWCQSLMSLPAQHPDVARIMAQLLVEVAPRINNGSPSGALIWSIMRYSLELRPPQQPSNNEYSEAVKFLYLSRSADIQVLARAFPNQLFDHYDELEGIVKDMLHHQDLDDRTQWGLRALLFTVTHRTYALDDRTKLRRLQAMLAPISEAWHDPSLGRSLDSFPAFCSLLALQNLPEYLSAAEFSSKQDWSTTHLDEHGRQLQSVINESITRLPLRMTTSILNASTERLNESSNNYLVASTLWSHLIPDILPNVLLMIKFATAFADISNWSQLSSELQQVVQKMLVDRFWQSGISTESKDDFSARVTGSGGTYEGFASTFRGAPRQIRDSCYHIIHGMTRFGNDLFGLTELPRPLAESLLDHAHYLSTHQLQRLISLIECLVRSCPPRQRQHFLPPLLSLTFARLDGKISADWDTIEASNTMDAAESDQLADEMKNESVVRATTYSFVSFVSFILSENRPTEPHRRKSNEADLHEPPPPPTLRTLVLSDQTILEPLIFFCTHALRMRDTRCCTIIARALSSILPIFRSSTSPAPQVRDYISSEVLKAAITSLNEPYFVDCQRDLATLIAGIISNYSPLTPVVTDLLASLPDVSSDKVQRTCAKIVSLASERQARAMVLDLLDGVRGVSIAESGKLDFGGLGLSSVSGGKGRKAGRDKTKEMYASTTNAGMGMDVVQRPEIVRGGSPTLDGVGQMFGEA